MYRKIQVMQFQLENKIHSLDLTYSIDNSPELDMHC